MKKVYLSVLWLLITMLLVWCWVKNEEVIIDEINEGESVTTGIDYLVLVNKQHRLPDDWEDKVELVEVQNAYDETIRVEKEAYEKYNELRDALLEEWVDIELDSVYRSVAKQQEIWDEFEEKYGDEYTKTYVATPWFSEHHTALALDICLKKDWELIYENEDMVKEVEIFNKVHAKLADYLFILRYLEGKEDITWYGYEPWHLRYVWDVNVAKEIMDQWITLEEYLWEVEVSDYDGVDLWESEIYSVKDRQDAVDVIMSSINNDWEIKVTDVKLSYLWDEVAKDNIDYCRELSNANTLGAWDECIVFTSSFHTPENSPTLEPDTDIDNYTWYLGRAIGNEWKLLTNWFN